MSWKHWLHGLVGAIIGGAAASIVAVIADPTTFNFDTGMKKIGTVALVSGIVSAAAYLKQSPIPSDEKGGSDETA